MTVTFPHLENVLLPSRSFDDPENSVCISSNLPIKCAKVYGGVVELEFSNFNVDTEYVGNKL